MDEGPSHPHPDLRRREAMHWLKLRALAAIGLGLGLLWCGFGCAPSFGSSSTDVLVIGGYSAIREALHNEDGLLRAFAKRWKKQTGRDLRFEESYSASGAQARAISAGFDADVAILAHQGDMDLLVKAKRVSPDWSKQENHGIVARSLVAIGYRADQPALTDFDDLAHSGLRVIYADPKTSGGARWNLNAIYGAVLRRGGREEDAAALLEAIQANVVAMDASARRSLSVFEMGSGDAIVTYENELLHQNRRVLENAKGTAISFRVPPRTLVVETPAAIVETSVKRHGNRETAEAFLAFMRSPEGQAILKDYGFRPLNQPIQEEGLRDAFRIDDIGGWSAVADRLYGPDGLWTAFFLRRDANSPDAKTRSARTRVKREG